MTAAQEGPSITRHAYARAATRWGAQSPEEVRGVVREILERGDIRPRDDGSLRFSLPWPDGSLRCIVLRSHVVVTVASRPPRRLRRQWRRRQAGRLA